MGSTETTELPSLLPAVLLTPLAGDKVTIEHPPPSHPPPPGLILTGPTPCHNSSCLFNLMAFRAAIFDPITNKAGRVVTLLKDFKTTRAM
ncbi:hypothetical protein PBY51_023288 [Eleginops maclovinus]|uniref:Uncharacterized protein n=1 Tax=Eleginops maclovinus TaxID=56733 RepID=A0AAN7X050_ELEMC|nr:hypothetical protein PBY51_023288 [Eleginops maclovinus]